MKTLPCAVLTIVVVATIAGGVLQGHMTLRWGPRPDMVAAAAMLEEIPTRCGNWQTESSSTMSDTEIRMLRCAGYVARQYVNQATGESVTLSIIFGQPGAISEHTPEACFSSRNFTQLGARACTTIECPEDSNTPTLGNDFWYVDFQNTRFASQRVRAYWAWSRGDRWVAPDGAKSTFAGSRQLYKIQLSTSMLAGGSMAIPDAPNDACGRFLKEFLPAAQDHLVVDAAERDLETDAPE